MIASEPPHLSPPPLAREPATRNGRQSSPAAVIFLYLVAVFIGAAFISPRLYASAQFLESVSYRFSSLADAPFHRYVSRCLILMAILALPSLLKALGLRSVSVLRLKWSVRHFVEAIHGLGWSFVALALLAALLVTFELHVLDLDHAPDRWLRHVKNALLSALAVGVLEEFLFRGALFGALRQRQSFAPAALCSSALYALLHFLAKPEHSGAVEWNSGLMVLGQMLAGFTHVEEMVPAFLNLLLLGCLLALVLERTGSLLAPIGLHAGIVFWLKTYNFMTKPANGASTWFSGTDKAIDGWATTLVLVLIFLLIEQTLPRRKEVTA